MISCGEIYAEMFKDVPKEVMFSMGYDLMLASGLLVNEQKMNMYDEFKDIIQLGEELEATLDWDNLL